MRRDHRMGGRVRRALFPAKQLIQRAVGVGGEVLGEGAADAGEAASLEAHDVLCGEALGAAGHAVHGAQQAGLLEETEGGGGAAAEVEEGQKGLPGPLRSREFAGVADDRAAERDGAIAHRFARREQGSSGDDGEGVADVVAQPFGAGGQEAVVVAAQMEKAFELDAGEAEGARAEAAEVFAVEVALERLDRLGAGEAGVLEVHGEAVPATEIGGFAIAGQVQDCREVTLIVRIHSGTNVGAGSFTILVFADAPTNEDATDFLPTPLTALVSAPAINSGSTAGTFTVSAIGSANLPAFLRVQIAWAAGSSGQAVVSADIVAKS